MKQKKLYETQRDQLYGQQFNVEQTSFALDSMKDSVQTVAALKTAGKELKATMKDNNLNISGIEKLQDQMTDMMVRTKSTAPSVSQAISTWDVRT
jgi:Snf7